MITILKLSPPTNLVGTKTEDGKVRLQWEINQDTRGFKYHEALVSKVTEHDASPFTVCGELPSTDEPEMIVVGAGEYGDFEEGVKYRFVVQNYDRVYPIDLDSDFSNEVEIQF